MRDDVALPGFVQIEPVGPCSLRCRMRPIAFRPERAPGHLAAHMDIDVYKRLSDEFGAIEEGQLQGPMRAFIDDETLLHDERERIAMHFDAARAEARRLGIALRLPNLTPRRHADDLPRRQRCDWPWRGAYVSYDGQAMPCGMVATPDCINFGNMAQQGVAQVWNNAAYGDFRAVLWSATPPEVCSSSALYRGTF